MEWDELEKRYGVGAAWQIRREIERADTKNSKNDAAVLGLDGVSVSFSDVGAMCAVNENEFLKIEALITVVAERHFVDTNTIRAVLSAEFGGQSLSALGPEGHAKVRSFLQVLLDLTESEGRFNAHWLN
jgi:hypothetical protein